MTRARINYTIMRVKSRQKMVTQIRASFVKNARALNARGLAGPQNMQNSEFAYFSSKSGKHMKQKSTPPFWGDAVMKKWSPFLIRGCRSCGDVEVVGVVGDVGLGVVVVVVEVRKV